MFTEIFTAGRTNILWKLCVSFDTDQEHKIGVHIPNKSPELFLEDRKSYFDSITHSLNVQTHYLPAKTVVIERIRKTQRTVKTEIIDKNSRELRANR